MDVVKCTLLTAITSTPTVSITRPAMNLLNVEYFKYTFENQPQSFEGWLNFSNKDLNNPWTLKYDQQRTTPLFVLYTCIQNLKGIDQTNDSSAKEINNSQISLPFSSPPTLSLLIFLRLLRHQNGREQPLSLR